MTDKERHEQTLILRKIEAEWRSLAPQSTPPLLWLARYPPIAAETTELNFKASFPEATWVLDDNGLREAGVWKWQRFVAVQMQPRPPWFTGMSVYPRSPVFGRTHEIGWAAFAPYENSDLYYIERVWGNLFGIGDAITFEDASKHLQKQLWIS